MRRPGSYCQPFVHAFIVLGLLACVPLRAWAGPADPTPFLVVQPDGTPVQARTVGDEWSNTTETLAGFAIVRNPQTGFWMYAAQAGDGSLSPTLLVAGRDEPVGLTPRLRPRPPTAAGQAAYTPQQAPPAVGPRKVLVLLVQFANKTASTTPAEWKARFFGPTGSVAHHFSTSSYGQVSLQPVIEWQGALDDGIIGWLTLPSNHPNTGGSTSAANQQLARDAILAADPYVNYSIYDANGDGKVSASELMIVIVAAGNETSFGGSAGACSPGVWAHTGQVASPPSVDGVSAGGEGYAQLGEMHCLNANQPGQLATLGTLAHEVGHLFGLPNLYDTDGSSSGVGVWSLMGSGSWNGIQRPGDSPAILDPWSKFFLGWVTPISVSGVMADQNIPASLSNSIVFQLRAGHAPSRTGEYFLVENRQKTSYDTPLPGAGLLVWHIDETRPDNTLECYLAGPACSTTVHYKVALVQADSLFHLEHGDNPGDAGDPFPGTSGKREVSDLTWPNLVLWDESASGAAISAISPSSGVMTATFSFTTGPLGSFGKISPAHTSGDQPLNVTLSWQPSSGAVGYDVCVTAILTYPCAVGIYSNVGNVTSLPIMNLFQFGLEYGTTYHWQVKAKNGSGTLLADNGAIWSFSTPMPPPGSFDKTSPAQDAANVPTATNLTWAASAGAVYYEYCIDTIEDGFCAPWINVGLNRTAPVVLTPGLTYNWQVRATNSSGTSPATWGFTRFTTASGVAPDAFEPDAHFGAASKLVGSQSHTFHVNNDQDWSRFSAGPGEVITIETSNLTDTADTLLWLFAFGSLTPIMTDDNGGGGLTSRLVFESTSSAKYYVRVAQANYNGTGSYTLRFSSNRTASPDAFEADNTPAAATPLAPGAAQSRTFHMDGDVDWVAIPVVWGKRYVLTTETLDTDTVLDLYGPDAATPISSDDDGNITAPGAANSKLVFVAVHTGVYYLRVSQYQGLRQGSYSLFLTEEGTNLIDNPGFDVHTMWWMEYGTPTQSYMVSNTIGGVYQFYRAAPPTGTNQAVLFQPTRAALPSGMDLALSVKLGNSDSVRKRISILVHDLDFSDLAVCTFWLPANSSLATYGMRMRTTKAWSNATVSFYAASINAPASTTGFYRVDDVTLSLDTGSAQSGACIDPYAPVPPGGADGPEMLINGDFSGGVSPWVTFGQLNSQLSGGVFEFVRPAGTPAGVVFQSTGQALGAGQIVTASLELGNSSAVRKRATVLIHDLDFSDLAACTFWLEPQTALQTFQVRAFTGQTWSNATISIYPATVSTDAWFRLDNVSLRSTPSTTVTGTECVAP